MKVHYLFILFFLLLYGCAEYHTRLHLTDKHTEAILSQKKRLLSELKDAKIQVIQLGDELRLVLPSEQFFVKNTAILKTASLESLNEVIQFLNQRENDSIAVLAYTPSLENFMPLVHLEQQQAEKIVDYFIQHGLNTRLIIANAWQGLTDRQKYGTGRFIDDAPGIFSIEIRTRLLHSEESS